MSRMTVATTILQTAVSPQVQTLDSCTRNVNVMPQTLQRMTSACKMEAEIGSATRDYGKTTPSTSRRDRQLHAFTCANVATANCVYLRERRDRQLRLLAAND